MARSSGLMMQRDTPERGGEGRGAGPGTQAAPGAKTQLLLKAAKEETCNSDESMSTFLEWRDFLVELQGYFVSTYAYVCNV